MMNNSLRYIFFLFVLATFVLGVNLTATATEHQHDRPTGTVENDDTVLPAGGERSVNQAPFAPELARQIEIDTTCFDVLGDLCVQVLGPDPADPDNNPVTYEYEWWVRTSATGGVYWPDQVAYPSSGNHVGACIPRADLHEMDEWLVRVRAVDPAGAHSAYSDLYYPMMQPNCGCTEFVPDGIMIGTGYCLTLDGEYGAGSYQIELLAGNGQIPVVYVVPGCNVPNKCTNLDCTPGDTSMMNIQCTDTSIVVNYWGGCGCFCLTFDHWLPVELTSFDARSEGEEIVLNWSTMSETNHDHFVLERRYADEAWKKIAEIRSLGNAVSGHDYLYRDHPASDGTYRYRLSGVSLNGNLESYPQSPSVNYSRVTVVPAEFGLEQNYPNPFNPETTIRYSLSEGSDVTLAIYSVDGRLVSTLVSGYQTAGAHAINFNGKALPSGVYVYRLTTGHDTAIRKMMLLK